MRLAVIPGDGIGPEVINEALKVLGEVARDVETTEYDLGAARWHSTGELLPETVLTEIKQHDAILLGAVGDPSVPSGILERGLLLRLRFELDHHVNLRPARLYPGVRGPLAGNRRSTWWSCARGPRARTSVPAACSARTPRTRSRPRSARTPRSASTRVVRDAFARAQRRPKKHLTLVHKTNVLTFAGALWSRIVEEVSLEYPEVSVAYQHVDSTTIHLVTDPGRYDVIVTDNLFGDILTDLAAAVTGGIGLAASGNIDASRTPRRCSSRCTARPRTSRARASPTRRPPCCRSRCCSTTWATATRPAASRPRSRSTWPPGPRGDRQHVVDRGPARRARVEPRGRHQLTR